MGGKNCYLEGEGCVYRTGGRANFKERIYSIASKMHGLSSRPQAVFRQKIQEAIVGKNRAE